VSREARVKDSIEVVSRQWSIINTSAFCSALCAMLFALCASASAQQATKIPRIGFLSGRSNPTPNTPDPNAAAFRRGLRDLGYVEGKNILIEYRYAGGKLGFIQSLVTELVQLNVDVLVATFAAAIHAAKKATNKIPIVFLTGVDPVEIGLVDSLARPGGNLTGFTRLTVELSGKRLELLKDVVPRLSRVGILWDADGPGPANAFKEYETAAASLKIKLHSLEVRGPNPDLAGAFQAGAKGRTDALVAVTNPTIRQHWKRIADLITKNRMPSLCEAIDYVEAGCLMSYSANEADQYRRAATYVDKILKGTKPTDIPVEQPTKFEFIINLKTAKQIGLRIPPNVLARADRVIR
jgi:putative tryptophan/tyrosine transport system substrate-binding protein